MTRDGWTQQIPDEAGNFWYYEEGDDEPAYVYWTAARRLSHPATEDDLYTFGDILFTGSDEGMHPSRGAWWKPAYPPEFVKSEEN